MVFFFTLCNGNPDALYQYFQEKADVMCKEKNTSNVGGNSIYCGTGMCTTAGNVHNIKHVKLHSQILYLYISHDCLNFHTYTIMNKGSPCH